MQSSSSRSEMFIPMLHVRRDLHHKMGASSRPTSTATSGLTEHRSPNFLSSIPLRKRPIGPDSEPYLPSRSINLFVGPHRNHQLLKAPEELMMPPIAAPDVKNESITSPGSLPHLMGSPPLISPPQQQQQKPAASAAPQKRTGFSIDDIMRR